MPSELLTGMGPVTMLQYRRFADNILEYTESIYYWDNRYPNVQNTYRSRNPISTNSSSTGHRTSTANATSNVNISTIQSTIHPTIHRTRSPTRTTHQTRSPTRTTHRKDR